MKTQLLVICGLLFMAGCNNQKSTNKNPLIGDWKLINSPVDDYSPLNVAHHGISIYEDSLEFISDYMSNPIFNRRKYSVTEDSIYINFENGFRAFLYQKNKDTLSIQNGEYDSMYIKLSSKTRNGADRIEFNSLNPGREENYFFDLTLSENGEFKYSSTSEDRVLEGQLKEMYVNFIFDKLHNINLPIRVDSNEVIPAGDHVFTLIVFENGTRIDSVTYSREIKGAYSKWFASILQSAPLWIDKALKSKN